MPEQLEKYGHQGHLGGWITSHLQGKTVECTMKDGTWLIIRTVDGHEYKIGWQDKNGNQLRGEPFMENLDVSIVLPTARLGAKAEDL